MQIITTKQHLLDEIKKCEEKINYLIKDEDKKEVFVSGIANIRKILTWCPSDMRFPDLGSLKFSPTLEDCIGEYTKEELQSRLDLICHDLSEFGNNMKDEIKNSAIYAMHKSKKTAYIFVILFLSIAAITALVLGIFSALDKIDSAWGEVIGTLDCAFGILFFAYELYDDKVKEAAINSGDKDLIKKYAKDNENIKIFIQKSIVNSPNATHVYIGKINRAYTVNAGDNVDICGIIDQLFNK